MTREEEMRRLHGMAVFYEMNGNWFMAQLLRAMLEEYREPVRAAA